MTSLLPTTFQDNLDKLNGEKAEAPPFPISTR